MLFLSFAIETQVTNIHTDSLQSFRTAASRAKAAALLLATEEPGWIPTSVRESPRFLPPLLRAH